MLPGISPVKFIVPPVPAQTVVGCETVLNDGAGFTVSTTFSPGELLQPLAVVVTTNVTTTGAAVVLVSVSLIVPLPLFAGWLIPAIVALDQLNEAPGQNTAGYIAEYRTTTNS